MVWVMVDAIAIPGSDRAFPRGGPAAWLIFSAGAAEVGDVLASSTRKSRKKVVASQRRFPGRFISMMGEENVGGEGRRRWLNRCD